MSLMTKVGFLAGAAATTLTGAALAGTSADVSYEDLQQRLDAAEAKITELSASQNADWMTEQRAEQIRGLVQDVLADADTRASLQGSGMSAGYDGGFVINSNDGNWGLKVNGLMQNRWVLSHTPEEVNPTGTDGVGNTSHDGFETTRAALNFSGHVGGKYTYNMRINWGQYANTTTPTNTELEWAYMGIPIADGWDLQLGRQKYDVMRSYIVNAEFQQAIDRGAYTYYWGTSSTTNGIKLQYSGHEDFHANVMYSNAGTNNITPFNSAGGSGAYSANSASWALSGRLEYKASGTWDQFSEMTSPQGTETGMLFGFGWAAMDTDDNLSTRIPNAAGRLVAPESSTRWMLTWDAALDFGGWNLYGSVTYGDDHDQSLRDIARANQRDLKNQWGWEIGGGWYLNEDIELFGRFNWLDTGMGDLPMPAASLGNTGGQNIKNTKTFTVGANWYLHGQNAKLSLDWSYQWGPMLGVTPDSPAVGGGVTPGGTAMTNGSSYTNFLANSNQDKHEWVLRAQMQLYF